jgi:AcrR family transcriptional regulator
MSVTAVKTKRDVSACQHYLSTMARWEPDARGRLEQAALALYAERGFENVTVTEIAERAGVTERTFFRHFADKREVLFGGSGGFVEQLVAPIAAAPAAAEPIDAAMAGLEAAAAAFEERREFVGQRNAIIAASPELRERELIKMAHVADAIADALRHRGVKAPVAGLTAQLAVAVFRTAFERWLADGNRKGFPRLVRESLDQVKTLVR